MKMRKGFTLVELLIVIVIIGVLAAAMLLSMGSATASAKATTIISDLRSMKSALLLLYADSMDNMPAVGNALTAIHAYIDNPSKYTAANGYAIEENTAKNKWSVSYDTTKLAAADQKGVQDKLKEKAESVGLYKDKEVTDKYDGGAKVFMVAR